MDLGKGICTEEEAKLIAQRFFEHYGGQKQLAREGLKKMLTDTYKSLSQNFSPEAADIDSLESVLDANKDGAVSLADIEELALLALVGRGDLKFSIASTKKAAWIEEKKKVAERLFKKFDTDGSGFLERQEIGPLIAETYKSVGLTIEPS
jgi:Ca2+-binding EF-hand superfamily protein